MHKIASVEPNKKGDSLLIRLVYIGGMIAIGTLLTVTGWQAISNRSYDFDWTVSDGSESSTSDERSAATSHEHLQEQDAVLHGVRGLSLVSKSVQGIRIDKKGLPLGWHEITVIGVSQHSMQMKTMQSTYVLIGDEANCPSMEASFDSMSLSESVQDASKIESKVKALLTSSIGKIRVRFKAANAERVALDHLGRRVLESDDVEKEHILEIEKTGYGPVRLTPSAMRDGIWVPGKPVIVTVD